MSLGQQKDFITVKDLGREEILNVLLFMKKIKQERRLALRDSSYEPFYKEALRNINACSIFNYQSMRTLGSYHIALSEMQANQNLHFNMGDMPSAYSGERISHMGKVLGGGIDHSWFNFLYVRFHGNAGDALCFLRYLILRMHLLSMRCQRNIIRYKV